MTSKNISISDTVYQELLKIKNEDESFSELFLRLIRSQKQEVEKCFGSWNLTKEEKEDIWDKIGSREGRKWKQNERSELK